MAKTVERKIIRLKPSLRGLVLLFLILSACTERNISTQSLQSAISGSVSLLSANSSQTRNSTSSFNNCSDIKVSVHEVLDADVIAPSALATGDVDSSGSFVIKNIRNKGISIGTSTVKYALKASGCGLEYSRPLTEDSQQNITLSSSFLMLTTEISDSNKVPLTRMSKESLRSLEAALDSLPASDLNDLLEKVIANNQTLTKFEEVFGFSPLKFKTAPPSNVRYSVPTSIDENSTHEFTVTSPHWHPDYVVAYEWSFAGTVLGTGASYSYTTGKDSQGVKNFVLRVGRANANGVIDTSLPVTTRSFAITVNDSFPPTAPPIRFNVNNNHVNNPVQLIDIDTGPNFSNCESFSKMALTNNRLVAPLPIVFNLDCYEVGTQDELLTLDGADGVKEIALWVMDSAGTISISPQVVSPALVLDRVPPTVNLDPIPAAVKGGANQEISFSFSDGGSGVDSASLAFTEDGLSFVDLLPGLTTSASSYSWSVPLDNKSNVRLKLSVRDKAGNQRETLSNNFSIDSTAPVLSFSEPDPDTAFRDTIQIRGGCETGRLVEITGPVPSNEKASCPLSGQFTQTITPTGPDGVKTIFITQTDLAGNSTTVSRNFIKDNVGPSITVAQSNPVMTNTNSVTFSGTCKGGRYYPNGNPVNIAVFIGGTPVANTSCSGTGTIEGTWSYTANQNADGVHNYSFVITDPASLSQSVAVTWRRDTVLPLATANTFKLANGNSTTPASEIPVEFAATDTLTPITKFCLKSENSLPTGTHSCWRPVSSAGIALPSMNTAITNYMYALGIIPQTYVVYLWVMDGAGNISTNTDTVAKDKASIMFIPESSPEISTVLAANSHAMTGTTAERNVTSGNDVFIRWTASGTNLAANPISLFYTTNEINWFVIQENLTNGNINCASLNDAAAGSASVNATGCFKWTAGAPSSGFFRVRVAVKNQYGEISFASSAPMNIPNFEILAGNTELGLNGSARSAVFLPESGTTISEAAGIVVTENGNVYYRDSARGIVYVEAKSGLLKMLVPVGASLDGQGDGGPAIAAKLKKPLAMALDFQGRLLVLDHDRIRRIDLNLTTPQITTLIGGGTNTSDAVLNPNDVKIEVFSLTLAPQLKVLPNGDIYFFSEAGTNYRRIRKYSGGTQQVTSIRPTGPGTSPPLTWNYGLLIKDATLCDVGLFDISFNQQDSTIIKMTVQFPASSDTSCLEDPLNSYAGNATPSYFINPVTGVVANDSFPPEVTSDWVYTDNSKSVEAQNGGIYRVDRQGGRILQYDHITNLWTSKVGTGKAGTCSDGTTALACNITPTTAFVDRYDNIYFVDSGRVRTISNNQVKTLYGQYLGFGDGGLATNARFNLITSLAKKTDSNYVIFDSNDARLRQFPSGGIITTVAGNGNRGIPVFTNDAKNEPLPDKTGIFSFLLDSLDQIYFSMNERIYRLPNTAAAKWEEFAGGAASPRFYEASANGLPATSIRLYNSAPVKLMGISNGSLTYAGYEFIPGVGNINGMIGEITLNTPIHTQLIGPVNNSTPGDFCTDSTLRTLCRVPSINISSYSNSITAQSTFDTQYSRWLFLDRNGKRVVAASNTTTTVSTAATFADTANALVYSEQSANGYLYYCSATDGLLRLKRISNGAEVLIISPLPQARCEGKNLIYEPDTKSLVFPFSQNGLMGVARIFNVSASDLGL